LPAVDTLFLPVGPVWVSWSGSARKLTEVRVDAESLIWTAQRLADDRYALDGAGSLRAGAFVFTTREPISPGTAGIVGGLTRGGTVVLSESQLFFSPRNRQHELIHVSQVDYLKVAFGTPIERWFRRGIGLEGPGLLRHVDLGLAHYPFQGLLTPLLEAEAERFEARYH